MTARTPEQDGARLMADGDPPSGDGLSGPRASRRIRRRLAFRADEALGDAQTSDEDRAKDTKSAKGKPSKRSKGAASPWQRAHEAWRHAGVPWVAGAEVEEPRRPEPTQGGVVTAAAPASPKEREDTPEAATPGVATPEKARRDPGLRRPSHVFVAGVVVMVVVAGTVAYALSGQDEAARPRSEVAAAVSAEGLFTTHPASTADGLVQDLTNVTAHGPTVIATGTEAAGDGTAERGRAQFLVSGDGGRNWRLAEVRTPDGAEPPPGDRPRLVAGGDGAWAAIGDTSQPGKAALWTAVDVGSWTREAEAGASFGPNDRVNALARTASGFAAVGVHSPGGTFSGDTRAVVWTSRDGRAWERNDRLNVPGFSSFGGLAASGGTLVAHGTVTRTVTRTIKAKGKRKARKVTSTASADALWRSADGGRTWAPVNVAHAQGSYGPMRALAAGPGGFYVTREGRTTTGTKKKRKTSHYGVLFGSRDGATWAPVARLSVPGYRGSERLAGTIGGLAALVRGAGGKGIVLLSADGRTWRPGSEVGPPGSSAPGVDLSGLTVTQGGGAVLTGSSDANGFLALAGATPGPGRPGPATPVDLTKVPGAVRPERTVNAIAPGADGRLLAAGSTSGGGALWITTGGSAWSRVDLGDPRTGLKGARGRFTDVAAGPHGWLAVGRQDSPAGTSRPSIVVVQDGKRGSGVVLRATSVSAVASGPGGYVVVGTAGSSPATWRSADLRRWTPGAGAGKDDLAGVGSMRDVAALPTGYVAVGGRPAAQPVRGRPSPRKPVERPAVWTSPDGRKWTAVTSPALPSGIASGTFSQVVARGDALVALGSGRTVSSNALARDIGFVARSVDGGRTWVTGLLPGMDATTTLTAVTSTAKGFLLAATSGAPGRQDVMLWTWTGAQPAATGTDWRRVAAFGTGLDGPGDQRLTALTAVGKEVVGTGVSADHRGETPTLWRTPAP